MTVRLNKYIADSTGLSRRKADSLIEQGQVLVNGKKATLGQSVDPQKDKVMVQGRLVSEQRKVYVAFHKPGGVVTTRDDPEGRKTIYNCLPEKYHHLDPVGRLDRDSTGLLLLTNDGDLLYRLTHPKFAHRKIYRVTLDKVLTEAVLEQLTQGVLLLPENQLAQCHVQEVVDPKTVVLVLTTGLNRQIRRCFEHLGYAVKKIKRTQFAGITLGSLRPGGHRLLSFREIKALSKPSKI